MIEPPSPARIKRIAVWVPRKTLSRFTAPMQHATGSGMRNLLGSPFRGS